MMDRERFEDSMIYKEAKTFVKEELFGQWLRKFFYLNIELNKEYDTIYQDSFYVVFYELVTVGIEYSRDIVERNESNSEEKVEFYTELTKGLERLKSMFTETELQFIEYRRHSASHIFQEHYEKRTLDNGKVLAKRKGKSIDDLDSELKGILIEYGGDKSFDINMTKKLYPKVAEIHARLVQIQSHYNN